MLPTKLLRRVDTFSSLPIELAQALQAAYQSSSLNAFTSIIPREDVESTFQSLPTGGPLHGVPVGIKDLFCTKDFPTTAASKMLSGYKSPFDATVVKLLKDSGAFIVGKTNMDEFGMGSENRNSAFGPVLNPSGPGSAAPVETRLAGGSSGGSAAAVAAGLCRMALASDTGGSTRLPAAYCGIVGLRPSCGLISRWGMISYASSLDTVGTMARRVADVRVTHDILAHFDAKDPTSVSDEVRHRSAKVHLPWTKGKREAGDLTGLRVGVPLEYLLEEVSPNVLPSFRRVLTQLKKRGAILSSVSLPSTPHALSAYYVIASAEASSNLARYDGTRFGTRAANDLPRTTGDTSNQALYCCTRSEGFGAEVQKRLLLGTHALSAEAFDNYFLKAQRVRKLIQLEFSNLFATPSPLSLSPTRLLSSSSPKIDILVHPSSINTAPLLHATSTPSNTEGYVQDVLNVPAALAGLPAMSIPAGKAEDGWPVGVQLVGQWGSENMLFFVGEALEEESMTL